MEHLFIATESEEKIKKMLPRLQQGFEEIKYCGENIDPYDYEPISFEYKGYEFYFESSKPYYAEMITPDGDKWECNYDYGYGAGF